MSISRRCVWLGYLVVVMGITIGSVPIVEGLFRLIGDEASFDLRGLYVPFAGDNYKLGANVDTGASLAAGRIFVHTDQYGLRCDQARRFGVEKTGEIDMLIIGDSQGFGNGINFEDTLAGSFAVTAAKNGVRVANASVGGHSLASQLEVVRSLVEEQQIVVRNYVILLTPALIESSNRLNRVIVGGDGRIYGSPPNLRMKGLLLMKTRMVTYARIRDAVRNLGFGVEPAKGSPTVFQFYRQDGDGEATTTRLIQALSDIRDFASKHGSTVHAVYVPLTIEAEFDSIRRAAAQSGVAVDPTLPFTRCATVTKILGIPLHNLLPVAEQVHLDGKALTVKADFHYSAALSTACGASLWNWLKKADVEQYPSSTTNIKNYD